MSIYSNCRHFRTDLFVHNGGKPAIKNIKSWRQRPYRHPKHTPRKKFIDKLNVSNPGGRGLQGSVGFDKFSRRNDDNILRGITARNLSKSPHHRYFNWIGYFGLQVGRFWCWCTETYMDVWQKAVLEISNWFCQVKYHFFSSRYKKPLKPFKVAPPYGIGWL